MIPLDITYEETAQPQRFAHIRSQDGILGHEAELRARIPVGTWVTVQAEYQPTVTTYLQRCGFRYVGTMLGATGAEDVLQKVED